MKIIMLSGSSSSGKTTTLNLVYDQLYNWGAKINIQKKQLGGNPNDFECELHYQTQRVAIFTMGDYSNRVTDAMSIYSQLGCDVLICACNDKFVRPYSAINNYPNSIVFNKTAVNSADVTSIINLI